MFKTALQLRIDPLFASTFVPTPQAVLDGCALDFLETFRGTSLIHRNLEEMIINLSLPIDLLESKPGYKVKYWCEEVQQRGIQCEYLDIRQILQTPVYPQIPLLARTDEEESPEEALADLVNRLFEQCGQETTAVNWRSLPGFYLEGWNLRRSELDQSLFWRFTLLFSSQKLVWFRQRPEEGSFTLPTIKDAFFSLVKQCTMVAQYPDWIAYNDTEGDGTVESTYEHARIYPVWQKEVGSLYRLVGDEIFHRLLRAEQEE